MVGKYRNVYHNYIIPLNATHDSWYVSSRLYLAQVGDKNPISRKGSWGIAKPRLATIAMCDSI